MPTEIIDPIGDHDVALIFEKPDKAPDTRRKIGLVGRLLRWISRAPASMLLKPVRDVVVERRERNPA
jgi:hypothetical protein